MQRSSARPVLTVLCADGERPAHLESLEPRLGIRYTDANGLADAVDGATALLLWDFFSTSLRDVWHRAGTLKWVHVAAAGVDTLLFDELTRSQVTVTNARGVFDRPIAEFVLMSILGHAKQAARSHDLQRAHRWLHRETSSVTGAHALVVGTGAIGRETARLLHAMGLQVRGAGRTARAHDPDFGAVLLSGSSSDLAAHVGWADYVVLVTPLTEQTRGVVNAEVLRAMKRSAYLVNVGRGPCVVEQDLLEALHSGAIAGAALEVITDEPLPPDHPLWDAPGATVSPHMSGDVAGWRDILARQFVDNAQRFLDHEPLMNVVDKELGYSSPT